MDKKQHRLIRDALLLVGSIVIAIVIIKTGLIQLLLSRFQGSQILGSFIAGMFFTSIFTTAPATVALATISEQSSIITVALFGALGALIGDLIVFRFVRDNVSEDFKYLIERWRQEKKPLHPERKVWHLEASRWVIPLIGALIIASPLPDEFGLILLGLSKTKKSIIAPLSFYLNFIGIAIIGIIARYI